MGKFDAEIGKAKKISDGWIKKAKTYQDVFKSIKKDSLALEKGDIKSVLKAAADGTADAHDRELVGIIRERLDMFLSTGQSEYEDFDKWALKEPRKSMGFIAAELKLGDYKTEAYKAVNEATKSQLNDVAAAISETQRAWRSDLLVALENHLDQLKTATKLLEGEETKNKALLGQLSKGIDRFKDECEKSYINLKADQFLQLISEINSGDINKMTPTQIQQRCQQAEQRTKVIPQIVAQIDKNFGRVVKSVPDNFLDTFIAAGQKKLLNDVYGKSKKDMATALKICSTALQKAKAAKIY